MILVDSSVWIDHFREADRRHHDFLKDEQVPVHPFFVGELTCGNLKNRDEIIYCVLVGSIRGAYRNCALELVPACVLADRAL